MKPQPALFAMMVALLLSSMMVGMVWAWIWAIRRLVQGRPLLPPSEPRVVPWGPGSVLLVVFAWLAVNFGVVLGYMALTGDLHTPRWAAAKPAPPKEPRTLSVSEQMLVSTLANALLVVVVPLLLRMTSGARLPDLGIRRNDVLGQVRRGVMAFLLLTPVVYTINGLVVVSWTILGGKSERHPLEKMVLNDPSVGIKELAILSAVLLAPAAEELIFRGIVQGWLATAFNRRKRAVTWTPVADPQFDTLPPPDDLPPPEVPERHWWHPPIPSVLPSSPGTSRSLPIILTSGLFAIVHLPQWPAPIAIFVLSLGLGLVYDRTGSLISSFVMHALFNGVATLLLFQAQFLTNLAEPKANAPKGFITIASQNVDPGRPPGPDPGPFRTNPEFEGFFSWRGWMGLLEFPSVSGTHARQAMGFNPANASRLSKWRGLFRRGPRGLGESG